MITEGAATRYIDEKYEFSAPQYYDFSAGETPEEAAEAERWFFASRSYGPSPLVAKCRSLLESKDFSSFKDTYNQVQKLLARLSSEQRKSNLSGSSGTSEEDVSANAKDSYKCGEAIPIAPTLALKQVNANLSVPAYISTILDPTPVSASSELVIENLAAPALVSTGKKEQILSSAFVNDSSCERIEESASVPVNIILSQKAEESTCSSASISVPETQDCQAEQADDNVPPPIKVSFAQNEDKSLLPVRKSQWGEIIWEYIHVLISQWIPYCRQFWLGEVIWEYIHAVFSQWLQYSRHTTSVGSSLVLGSSVEGHNLDKSEKEATVNAAVVCDPMQKVEIVEFSTPKCEQATEYSERSSNMHGKLLAKRDHFEVEKHESQIKRHGQHLKKMKHTQTRYYRKTEMVVTTETSYANKRQKLEGGQARQVCNSRRSVHSVKAAVPTLTIPQEFHFQTEERFQTHRGVYCQSFSQTQSPVSPYVPLAERVLRFQFKASECYRNRSVNQALKLTRPKEPDLATAQRARPPRVKSTAEIEEEILASMPKFKARPLNKKILEGPTLAALPRSMPQVPEFQEFNLRTAERALQHPSASHKGAELDRHNSLMGGRFSAPYKSFVFTTLHAQSVKERSLEGMEEKGPAKVSQFSSYSSDKKLIPGPSKERQSVTKGMMQINENMVFEAESLVSKENVRVPDRTRKPLANIQCNCLPLESCGNQVKTFAPTLGSRKEKGSQCWPNQPSQEQAHRWEPKDPATQMNAIIPWQDSWTSSSTFISRQMR